MMIFSVDLFMAKNWNWTGDDEDADNSAVGGIVSGGFCDNPTEGPSGRDISLVMGNSG